MFYVFIANTSQIKLYKQNKLLSIYSRQIRGNCFVYYIKKAPQIFMIIAPVTYIHHDTYFYIYTSTTLDAAPYFPITNISRGSNLLFTHGI